MSANCCGRVVPAGGIRSVGCRKPAKVERDGKHYCTVHDPVRRAQKNAERCAEEDARYAMIREQRAISAAAAIELQRRADCYDDLASALHLARMSLGWQSMSKETREVIDAALAKAGSPA
jgi:hypothetical protein